MYQDPYDHRTDHRFRPRFADHDFWPGVDDPREPEILDSRAQRWLVAVVLIVAGLGASAAILVG